MSYGIAMAHYKYPLSASLDKAHDLLKNKAKKGTKNAISWEIVKHSGHSFGDTLSKEKESIKLFLGLRNNDKDETFLASVITKLAALEGLFLATADMENFDDFIHNILFNNFNESVHRNGNELSDFLKKVEKLLKKVFEENSKPISTETDAEKIKEEKKKRVKNNLEKVYAALRFVQFLKTEDKE